jgi:hypothetical protein
MMHGQRNFNLCSTTFLKRRSTPNFTKIQQTVYSILDETDIQMDIRTDGRTDRQTYYHQKMFFFSLRKKRLRTNLILSTEILAVCAWSHTKHRQNFWKVHPVVHKVTTWLQGVHTEHFCRYIITPWDRTYIFLFLSLYCQNTWKWIQKTRVNYKQTIKEDKLRDIRITRYFQHCQEWRSGMWPLFLFIICVIFGNPTMTVEGNATAVQLTGLE